MAGNEEFLEAVRGDELEVVEKLLSENQTLAAAEDVHGVTAVLLALYNGHLDLANKIARFKEKLTLFEAAALGDTENLNQRITENTEEVNEVSPDGFSALGLASFFGQPAAVKILLEHGAAVDEPSKNKMKVRPLHSAAATRDNRVSLEISRLLLEAGADANAKQQDGFAPIHEAAQKGNEELVDLLVRFGADVGQKSDHGFGAAYYAEKADHLELAKKLAAMAG